MDPQLYYVSLFCLSYIPTIETEGIKFEYEKILDWEPFIHERDWIPIEQTGVYEDKDGVPFRYAKHKVKALFWLDGFMFATEEQLNKVKKYLRTYQKLEPEEICDEDL